MSLVEAAHFIVRVVEAILKQPASNVRPETPEIEVACFIFKSERLIVEATCFIDDLQRLDDEAACFIVDSREPI